MINLAKFRAGHKILISSTIETTKLQGHQLIIEYEVIGRAG